MSDEGSKGVVRRYFDVVNNGQLDVLSADLLTSDFRLHFDSMPELARDDAVGFFGGFVAAFPGIDHSIEDQFAEGDRVATRIVVRGTHGGDLMGLPPTGKDIEINAINIHRIVDGRIAELWIVSDGLGMMRQLGVVPPPGE